MLCHSDKTVTKTRAYLCYLLQKKTQTGAEMNKISPVLASVEAQLQRDMEYTGLCFRVKLSDKHFLRILAACASCILEKERERGRVKTMRL